MFFNKSNENNDTQIIKIAALLIHAAKIDEKYSNSEDEIIKQTLIELGSSKSNLENIIDEAKDFEEKSNHILEFTKEVKNMKEDEKIKIVKSLWKIIYSNKDADIYETNLMRRLAGLLYIDSKTMGDIKETIRKENL